MSEIKNKSEFVRGVLRDIGAITVPAPDGWRQKVEKALEDQKIKMHQVMIYAIRRAELEKSGLMPAAEAKPVQAREAVLRNVGKKADAKIKPAPVETANNGRHLSVQDLLLAKKHAQDFGGVEKLSEALSVLAKLV